MLRLPALLQTVARRRELADVLCVDLHPVRLSEEESSDALAGGPVGGHLLKVGEELHVDEGDVLDVGEDYVEGHLGDLADGLLVEHDQLSDGGDLLEILHIALLVCESLRDECVPLVHGDRPHPLLVPLQSRVGGILRETCLLPQHRNLREHVWLSSRSVAREGARPHVVPAQYLREIEPRRHWRQRRTRLRVRLWECHHELLLLLSDAVVGCLEALLEAVHVLGHDEEVVLVAVDEHVHALHGEELVLGNRLAHAVHRLLLLVLPPLLQLRLLQLHLLELGHVAVLLRVHALHLLVDLPVRLVDLVESRHCIDSLENVHLHVVAGGVLEVLLN
mmetsp:Transcript_13530/g.53637  ORF Transcript_13530/g.53637 Transcript_13530/m.53637 type:complete len:334 (-) Transcript_13530:446-1447(-)